MLLWFVIIPLMVAWSSYDEVRPHMFISLAKKNEPYLHFTNVQKKEWAVFTIADNLKQNNDISLASPQ